MAVFRVEKNNYTLLSNHHLPETKNDAKQRGLLSQILTSGKLGLYPCRTFPYQQKSIDAVLPNLGA